MRRSYQGSKRESEYSEGPDITEPEAATSTIGLTMTSESAIALLREQISGVIGHEGDQQRKGKSMKSKI